RVDRTLRPAVFRHLSEHITLCAVFCNGCSTHCLIICLLSPRPPPSSTLFPYTTLFRSRLRRRLTSRWGGWAVAILPEGESDNIRSEEHTSELQSRFDLVCRLLLEKKKE